MPRRCGRPLAVGFCAVPQVASPASSSRRQQPSTPLRRSAQLARDALVLEHLPLTATEGMPPRLPSGFLSGVTTTASVLFVAHGSPMFALEPGAAGAAMAELATSERHYQNTPGFCQLFKDTCRTLGSLPR
jgi:hypothetical protein